MQSGNSSLPRYKTINRHIIIWLVGVSPGSPLSPRGIQGASTLKGTRYPIRCAKGKLYGQRFNQAPLLRFTILRLLVTVFHKGFQMSEFGYAGKILKIDLSEHKISTLDTSNYAGRFTGGRGIAAKIYWDKTTAETRVSDPQNCLVFMTGPLAGFTHLAGNRWQICGKSFGSGPIVDWNLKTTLDGLYAAGMQLFSPSDHSYCASTGRYAGRKAADYARQVSQGQASAEQIASEKARVYAPIKRNEGLDWKELHAGIARVMQYFCSEFKTDSLLKMGLDSMNEIEEKYAPYLYALDPHKLMRGLEDLSFITCSQIVFQASLARKASSQFLDLRRIDYPEVDPPEWNKFITLKLQNNQVKVGSLPWRYYGNMKENYEAYNKDYTGVYKS
jgi:hypothetical protein